MSEQNEESQRVENSGQSEDLVEEVKSTDLDDKVEIFKEALRVAYEHGNAEKLLRDVVHNVAPNVKQAAATEAVSSDKEAASYILSQAAKQAPLEDKKETVKEAVDNTDNQRAAREVIIAAMSAAPEASKDAVAKVVRTADSEDQLELLTQAIDSVPASIAEAAIKDARISLTPPVTERVWLRIIGALIVTLVIAVAALIAVPLLNLPVTDTLSTVVALILGILAGQLAFSKANGRS